ncbi:hypothetical protein MNEG_4788 [Monoraphidium neglectum]|uniref:Uncharacterized protein n=1 Tax=Monoraphidium neglectum TaxID=145388 RepID=A0A0D2JX27_9CHLO|nr:hypothetical protein MNEG_4788 [Monoraphidium neglectum]KIZ03173.1 hypothetical protein MNEG_4788 [Monoraphidium neglectum]|eukprot:XP_013902192.1 hypothetical protein MNEG_4788 [Monoraphidium neglectum]
MDMLRAAATWQEAVGLFRELGDGVDKRSAGLVAQMFTTTVTLMPGPVASLPPREAAEATAALDAMLAVMTSGVERVVTVLGIGLTGRLGALEAGEAFDAAAALALLNYRPPPKEASVRAGDEQSPDLVEALQRRSIRAFKYLTPKDTANAVFVLSRIAAPGSVTAEWLKGYIDTSFDHLPHLQGEALVLAGYMPARHNHLPDAEWRAAWIGLIGQSADALLGAEFPLVLFSLAKWQQVALQQRRAGPVAPAADDWLGGFGGGYGDEDYYGGYGGGARQPQQGGKLPAEQLPAGWLDGLLLASHRSGALRELGAKQLGAMLRALGALGAAPSAPWASRMWAAVGLKISAAVRAGGAGAERDPQAAAAVAAARPADVAALLAAWAALPACEKVGPPQDIADEAVSFADAALRSVARPELERVAGALQASGCGGGVAARLIAEAIAAAPVPAAAAAPAAGSKRPKAPAKKAAGARRGRPPAAKVVSAAKAVGTQLIKQAALAARGPVFVIGAEGQASLTLVRELATAGVKVVAAVSDGELGEAVIAFAKKYELIPPSAAGNVSVAEVDLNDLAAYIPSMGAGAGHVLHAC